MKITKDSLKKLAKKLQNREKELLLQKEELEKQDIITDPTRITDNNDPDVDADEQNSHEKAQTLKSSIERNLRQVRRALSAVDEGTYGKCDICGGEITKDRLKVFPTATLCTSCREKKEEEKDNIYRRKDILTSR